MNVSERIQNIQKAVEKMAKCQAVHIMSVPILEFYGGQTVWEGVVEVFGLQTGLREDRAYGWSHKTDKGDTEHTVVLGIPPINSAQDAVRAAVAASIKRS